MMNARNGLNALPVCVNSPVRLSFALVICALPSIGMAQDLCVAIKSLVPQAQANFTAGNSSIAGAETCQTALSMTGAKTLHCAWGFDYRADAALSTFQSFDTDLSACFADFGSVTTDQSVNHPDTYDLRQYQTGDVVVSISLKDKGAMQRTFVFVGIAGVAPN